MRLRRHQLELPWGRLTYWQAGSGPILLALHGLGGSGRYWQGLASRVSDRYTVIAPDHAGFGHSDKPEVAYTRAFHLNNLDALVDQVASDQPVTVVGHSLGGALAGLWAARQPSRAAALALVAAPYPGGERMPESSHRTYEHDQRSGRQRVYRALQATWPVLTFPVRSRVFPRGVISDYMRHTLSSYWGTAQAVLWDPAAGAEVELLSGLRAPALLLTASDDRQVSAGNADRWASLLGSAQRRVVTGGHQLLLRGGAEPLVEWLVRP